MLDVAEIALVFVAFFAPGYAAGPAAQPEPIAVLVAATGQFLLLLYLMAIRGEPDLAGFGVELRPRLRDLAVAAVAAIGLLAVSSSLSYLAALLDPQSAAGRLLRPPSAAASPAGGRLWWAPLALVTGYREELFFRCYFITRLRRLGASAILAVGSSAVLFAAGHLYQGAVAVALAALEGLAFGALLARGERLHALALAHALYNMAVLALQGPAAGA